MTKKYNNSLEFVLEIVGGKWKVHILYNLADGPVRTGQLKSSINGVTQKVLTNQLRELEKDGLVVRKSYNQVPPKVEYSLTDTGKTLHVVLKSLCDWGKEYTNFMTKNE
ncbi:winged helix-turn-helix transcriptional regulator [Enterococcus faecalis]|nr:helix-turn-helix domain-containing protein [Enterococcus faecalis]